jgi:hypothetical protein
MLNFTKHEKTNNSEQMIGDLGAKNLAAIGDFPINASKSNLILIRKFFDTPVYLLLKNQIE